MIDWCSHRQSASVLERVVLSWKLQGKLVSSKLLVKHLCCFTFAFHVSSALKNSLFFSTLCFFVEISSGEQQFHPCNARFRHTRLIPLELHFISTPPCLPIQINQGVPESERRHTKAISSSLASPCGTECKISFGSALCRVSNRWQQRAELLDCGACLA